MRRPARLRRRLLPRVLCAAVREVHAVGERLLLLLLALVHQVRHVGALQHPDSKITPGFFYLL